jgi:hypothetical protein
MDMWKSSRGFWLIHSMPLGKEDEINRTCCPYYREQLTFAFRVLFCSVSQSSDCFVLIVSRKDIEGATTTTP